MAKKKKKKIKPMTFTEAFLFGLSVGVATIAPELLHALKRKR